MRHILCSSLVVVSLAAVAPLTATPIIPVVEFASQTPLTDTPSGFLIHAPGYFDDGLANDPRMLLLATAVSGADALAAQPAFVWITVLDSEGSGLLLPVTNLGPDYGPEEIQPVALGGSPVAEPGTLLLMLSGVFAMVCKRFWKKRDSGA